MQTFYFFHGDMYILFLLELWILFKSFNTFRLIRGNGFGFKEMATLAIFIASLLSVADYTYDYFTAATLQHRADVIANHLDFGRKFFAQIISIMFLVYVNSVFNFRIAFDCAGCEKKQKYGETK